MKRLVVRLRNEFRSRNHKRIMLIGLYLSAIVIFFLLAPVAWIMGYPFVFWKNLVVTLFLGGVLIAYLRSERTPLYALLLILVVEADCTLMTLGSSLNHFITIYPFFIIFGFFFFFRLREAAWMTLLHALYWLGVMAYGYHLFPGHPMFHILSLMNMAVGSVVVFIFGLFYYLSTEVTYEELEKANRQKEILLREIHHRIKNNLNKISSMIGLQILALKQGKAEAAHEVLQKSKLRIEAMATVHEALYKTERIDRVNFHKYMENLARQVGHAYGKRVPIAVRSDDISLSLDVMLRLGIVINELMTNSIKYAGGENETPKIEIDLEKRKSVCRLVYRQNGTEPIDPRKLLNSETLGMKLIRLTIR
ncbi:sensor histidine kinase, partial [Hydrogenimonas sp.]